MSQCCFSTIRNYVFLFIVSLPSWELVSCGDTQLKALLSNITTTVTRVQNITNTAVKPRDRIAFLALQGLGVFLGQ